MRIKGPNLNELLKTPLNLLEDNCIDQALLAAVDSGSLCNAEKLILCGAGNIDEALTKSRKEKQYTVTAALLIIKTAIENDKILVLKLYGENINGDTKIPLTEEDDLSELKAAVATNNIKTVVPIEISRRHNAEAVREELLLRTGVDKDSGVVLWFGLRLTQLEISWLRKIYWVKKLRLARNEFSSLPPEMGSYLKQCTKLDLQWNRIREIPQCLLELPSINELNLSHNDLVDIPDVPEWSASLSILDLSYNCLSNLPNSAVAPTLKNLNISNNQFRTVPHCVCSFVGLTTLNIANNSGIRNLPLEFGRLKNLLNLNLDGLNRLSYPPRHVRVTTADCIQYLNNRLRSAHEYYHMKMMLVGKHAVGKSTIVARLHNKDIGNESTVGVDVSEWKYAPAYNKKTFHFSIWDFAGQEEYYATHQCFLSKRSLYLLVWNVTEGDAGVADLKPWLNNISVQAPNSCVIVVGTFLDKVSEEDRQSGKIDAMLPEKRPDIVAQQQLDDKSCYKHFILFRSIMAQGQCFRHLTPLGLWSRLLSRIMNTVKEVKNILSEYIPIEEEYDLIISTNVHLTSTSTATSAFTSVSEDPDHSTENGVMSETSSKSNGELMEYDRSTVQSPVLSSPLASVCNRQHLLHEESHRGSVEVFSIEGGGNLVYWRTGLFYKVNNLTFSIESLAELKKYQDKDGVLIMASQGAEGRKILGQLIDIVEQLISEWYPGLNGELEQKVPCIECIKSDIPNPYEFKVDQLLPLIADHKLTHKCGSEHNVKLLEIVPDLLLQDLDPAFLLDPREVIYKQERESLLGTGAFGEVYRGKYKGRAIAIKLYTAKENTKVEEGFKELRSESKVLQQLYHPSLVCMVGVTVHPMMSLVLEEAPEGSLQAPLLREQRPFSRIVLHRIAIQVASALRFLHSINIIFRDLKADNVLLWSLSPDHLINCKVTDFNIAAHADPGGARGLHGTKGFIAPEVAHVNHAKECSVYDHRADIFSFGMFLYQLLARRHPFHNVQPFKIEAAIEEGLRPQLEDVSVAETGLYYLSRVMKLCWDGSPKERPTSQQIVEWLSASALQLIISVVPVSSKYSIRNGCIVTPVMSNEVGPVPTSSELWICCDGVEGTELSIFTTNTMVKAGIHFVRENQVRCMKQCGEHVWVASKAGLECGEVNIFNNNTKDLIDNIKMKENTVSCITNSDQLVYMGTMEGYCFAFPMYVATLQANSKPRYKYVSEHCVDGVALTHTCLWASTRNQIHFLHPETLDLEGVQERTKNIHAFVGKMMLSDNGDQMWAAHLGGVVISAWNAHLRTHICDVDVGVLAKEKFYIVDSQDCVMTAMCTALDTVWIGLASGYIMVFGMNPPGELLTHFRPYNSFIRFLSASKYPGPCQKEECMMLCGGKMCRPDDSFKELTDYRRKDKKGEPVDTAGVAVLWEILPAKYIRQVHLIYLSDGKSWLTYSTLERTMRETGFTESLKHCHSIPVNLPAVNTMQDNSFIESDGEHQESEQECTTQLNTNPTVNNGISGNLSMISMTDALTNDAASEEIKVDLGGGYQLRLSCEQPITLKSVISKIALKSVIRKIAKEARAMGDLLLTYHLDGGNELVTINNDEQMEHYLQLPERPNLHVEQLK